MECLHFYRQPVFLIAYILLDNLKLYVYVFMEWNRQIVFELLYDSVITLVCNLHQSYHIHANYHA